MSRSEDDSHCSSEFDSSGVRGGLLLRRAGRRFAVLLALLLCQSTSAAAVPLPVVDLSGATGGGITGGGNFDTVGGWEFSVSSPLTVTHLGSTTSSATG